MKGRAVRGGGCRAIVAGLALIAASGSARGQGHHAHGGLSSSRFGPSSHPGAWVGPGHPRTIGRDYWPHGGGSPFVTGLGGVFLPVVYPPLPIAIVPAGGGLMLPNPGVPPAAIAPTVRAKAKPEPAKADGYVNLGDNLFRAGNTHRAEQRYLQAVRANPNSATPHVRLAQLALVRGDFREAADRLRAASAAEPGWLINAKDVQSLFAEPGDFARALAKLETHLQAEPTDRDGWLVLGAEWFLSGRARQAADVFTRLNDRKADPTLASFLDATTPDAIARSAR